MSDTDSTIRPGEAPYRSKTTPLHVWHDTEDTGSLSTTVVTAVAKAASVEPVELPPLYETIDPDALDKLLGASPAGSRGYNGYVTFGYADYSVTVHADGEIVVHELDLE